MSVGPGLAALLLMLAAAVAAADVADRKARMDAVQDLQYDLQDGLDAKDAGKAGKAAAELDRLLRLEDASWRKAGFEDVAAQAVGAASAGGRWEAAAGAYGELQATCRSCHDLHPEKRPPPAT
ncbi:hypothetical protein C5708_15385 [Caulobacter sp. CCUG 60055]|uniref:hypothetical protein n=1 Tax=Caulobacter sp. CCUG 60055 TaxID=2100090 RepID=UPI001FA7FDCA|nr:hypothetical protein [Caulobacter sp. CCUG 60055]MCI3181628.1 hypothetical protein [Caulobacter sp. CCUG 60055]